MDPFRVVILVVFVLLAVGIGRLRREPLSVTALNAVGGLVFMLSVFWASEIGPEASTAAFGASLGAILFTMGWAYGRSARSAGARPNA
jgi:hypothetical protein